MAGPARAIERIDRGTRGPARDRIPPFTFYHPSNRAFDSVWVPAAWGRPIFVLAGVRRLWRSWAATLRALSCAVERVHGSRRAVAPPRLSSVPAEQSRGREPPRGSETRWAAAAEQ